MRLVSVGDSLIRRGSVSVVTLYQRGELLFPHRCIATLAELRTARWQELVKKVRALPEDHEESLAFCFLLVELCGCLNCDLNSYKASLGCRACARRAVLSFKDGDAALQRRFENACAKVKAALAGKGGALSVDEGQ